MRFPARFMSVALALVTGCASSSVVVRIDDNGTDRREVQKLDCRVYAQRSEWLRAGPDFGLLFGAVKAGPYVERTKILSMNWDKSVHQMVSQYKELCALFNTGAVSLEAYDRRLAEVDQLWAEGQGIRQSIDDATRNRARRALDDLGPTPKEGQGSSAYDLRVANAVDAFTARVGVR